MWIIGVLFTAEEQIHAVFLLLPQDLYASFSMIAVAQSDCYLGSLAERENVISLQILFLIIRDLEFQSKSSSYANKF